MSVMTHMFRRGAAPKIGLAGLVLVFASMLALTLSWSSPQASAAPLPVPATVADVTDDCNKTGFLGLKPWYHYMQNELGVKAHGKVPADPCGVRCFNIFVQAQPNDCGQTQSDVPGVILVVIDDLLRIAGLVAVAFIIIGAFQYVGSRGNAERTASAQSTIIGALTGLAVALVAVALVSFLGRSLG